MSKFATQLVVKDAMRFTGIEDKTLTAFAGQELINENKDEHGNTIDPKAPYCLTVVIRGEKQKLYPNEYLVKLKNGEIRIMDGDLFNELLEGNRYCHNGSLESGVHGVTAELNKKDQEITSLKHKNEVMAGRLDMFDTLAYFIPGQSNKRLKEAAQSFGDILRGPLDFLSK